MTNHAHEGGPMTNHAPEHIEGGGELLHVCMPMKMLRGVLTSYTSARTCAHVDPLPGTATIAAPTQVLPLLLPPPRYCHPDTATAAAPTLTLQP